MVNARNWGCLLLCSLLYRLLRNLHSSFSCVRGVGMFVVAANQLISGVCDSSSWAASVMASPVISSSSVEPILVPLMCYIVNELLEWL